MIGYRRMGVVACCCFVLGFSGGVQAKESVLLSCLQGLVFAALYMKGKLEPPPPEEERKG